MNGLLIISDMFSPISFNRLPVIMSNIAVFIVINIIFLILVLSWPIEALWQS